MMSQVINATVSKLYGSAARGRNLPRLVDDLEGLLKADTDFWATTATLIAACKPLCNALSLQASRKVLRCISRSWAVRCSDRLRALADHQRQFRSAARPVSAEELNDFILDLLEAHLDDLNGAFWVLVALNHRLSSDIKPDFIRTSNLLTAAAEQRATIADNILQNVEAALRLLLASRH